MALFPASFDPLTNGHLDLCTARGACSRELVVAIAKNIDKTGTFDVDERLDMLKTVLGEHTGVDA